MCVERRNKSKKNGTHVEWVEKYVGVQNIGGLRTYSGQLPGLHDREQGGEFAARMEKAEGDRRELAGSTVPRIHITENTSRREKEHGIYQITRYNTKRLALVGKNLYKTSSSLSFSLSSFTILIYVLSSPSSLVPQSSVLPMKEIQYRCSVFNDEISNEKKKKKRRKKSTERRQNE